MAERIVDVLEPIQVQEQHRHRAALAPRPHDRARQPFGQQRAVGQAGQRVVVGQVAQFLLGALLVGDVFQHHHMEAVPAVGIDDRVAAYVAEDFQAVLAPLPGFAAPGPAVVVRRRRRDIGRMVEQRHRLAEHFAFAVAGDAGEGRVDRDEAEVLVQHRDRFAHAAQHFAGDAPFQVGLAVRGDVARGAGEPTRLAVGAVVDHAAAHPCPQPRPVACQVHPVLGHVHRGQSLQVFAQRALGLRHVVGVDVQRVVLADHHGDLLRMRRRFVGAHPAQLALLQVVVPEVLAGGP